MLDGRTSRGDSPRATTLQNYVRDHAAHDPDAAAILSPGRPGLSYGQLASLLDAVGQDLGAAGISRFDRIVLVLPPGADAAVATVAIAAHAVCAPLNPDYSGREFAVFLSRLRARALLVPEGSSSPAIDAATALGMGILTLRMNEASRPRIVATSQADLAGPVADATRDEDAALLLFTSGTTAVPKLVSLTHRQLCLSAENVGVALELEARDRCLGVMPLFHIHGLSTLLATLVSGGCYVGLPGFSPERIVADFAAFRPSWYSASPAIHGAIADAVRRHGAAPDSLRFVRSASAAMPVSLIDEIERAIGVPLIEAYGMTEAAPQIASNRLPPFVRKPGSVGKPAGPEVTILDEAGRPLGGCEPGEVAIRGATVIERYEDEPGDRFADGWLRTGDVGRFDTDGHLFITGRVKDIINRGGEKISPAWIEAVLLDHPGVRDAAAFGIPHAVLGEAVAAAIVPAAGATGDRLALEVRDFAVARLARFEVPQQILVVDRIPRTAAGKVNRRSLAESFRSAEERARRRPADATAPRTAAQARVAGVFGAVLGSDAPGIRADFFELGGDSLAAMRVLSRLQEIFGLTLAIETLFANPTVEGIAARIGEQLADRAAGGGSLPSMAATSPGEDRAAGVRRRGAEGQPARLSRAQERVFFLDRMGAGAAYTMSAPLWLTGPLDEDALARAIREIVRRHAVLRACFAMRGDRAVQTVAPASGQTPFKTIDLSVYPEGERMGEAKRLATAEGSRAFDLAAGPLFRATLVRLSPAESVLLLTMHHMVSDAWSTGVLYDELTRLYAAFRDGLASPLGEPPLQYGDFAAWEAERIRDGGRGDGIGYWADRLAGLPPTSTFPPDTPRPASQSYRGETFETFLDGDLIDRLKALARDRNATPFMILLAAFKALLFRHTDQEDCVVGVPIANRPLPGFEALVGFFANTLALRTSLAGDPSFVELLDRVRETALGAFDHQDTPLEHIVDTLNVSRDPGRMPLFQIMFAFQNVGGAWSSSAAAEPFANSPFDLAPSLAARPFRVDNGTAKFDLTLYLSEADGGVRVAWQFDRDLYEPATIGRIAGQFETLLRGIAADPQRKLSELPLLSEAERRRIEIDWNATEARQPLARSVVEMFEAQAGRTPDALAVVGKDARLSYGALNQRANRVARHLRGRGLRPGSVVAVCLPRTPDTAAVLIGVWKAGLAYLPLDPGYPPARNAFAFRDADARLLVTLTDLLPNAATLLSAAGGNKAPDILCLDASEAAISRERPDNLGEVPPPDGLAYVIYTSGSTGHPKGVMIGHDNVCHYVQALGEAIGIKPSDRYLHTASFAFSSSVRQFAVPLAGGAAVVLATAENLRDPEALFETIRDEAATIVDLVPSFAAGCLQVLASLAPARRAALLDNDVRLVLSASEPLPSGLVEAWRRLCGSEARFINMYGQTETAGIVLTYPVPGDPVAGALVPIGRPIANTRAYVLDDAGHVVPVGLTGELHLDGAAIGRGYVGGPGLPATAFAATAFAGHEGKRLYRTGDLARYRADGVIVFAGRVDGLIKLRGFRIEPGEIEAAIMVYPGVRECAVIATGDEGSGGRLLVAYVADNSPGTVDPSFAPTLRAFLSERLPQHMVPTRMVRLPRLPRSPAGKLDLQALRTLDLPVPQDAASAATNRGVADMLTDIWKRVLHVDAVAPGDNFFDLGGNSRLSLNVLLEAERSGLAITLPQIYRHQTLAELARVAAESGRTTGQARAVAESGGEDAVPRLTVDSLRAFGREALVRAGLDRAGAEIVAEVQLEASLRGQPTHDMVSIPRYATRIAAGRINPRPRIRIEREGPGTALIDGDNGPGQWVSMVAMGIAMEKADAHGIGVASARRSNHFGAAGHYAWEAARRGLIGLCTTNGPAVLAPTGGVTPTFGNNPLAIGIPAGRHLPILLDIAMSVAPRSRIGLAVAEARSLPAGWILDGAGRPSTDLADLAAGLGVPIGGHKGYGLALALEVLAGVLAGAGFAADHRPDALRAASAAPDFGHFFVAIDPERFMPAAAFAVRVDRLIEQTRGGQRAAGAEEILIPGERELRARERNLKEGVRLIASTYRALLAYGKEKQLDARLIATPETAPP